jgi:hypothetical protein
MPKLNSDEFEDTVYEMAKEAIQDGKLTRTLVIFEYIDKDGKLRYGMLHPRYMSNNDSLDMIQEAMMHFFPGDPNYYDDNE